MKASVLHGVNEPYVYQEFEKPIPNENEVLIKVSHAALNHRDVWIQKGQYAGLTFPIICGSDGCGVVESVGQNVEGSWVGKEVIVNPSMNWGDNPRFQAKNYVILGLPNNGMFAEYVVVPSRLVYEKPKHLSSEKAAAFPLAGLTGYRALLGRAKAKEGETVLITGVGGGVALFAAQFAIAAKCKVYVTSGSDEKIKQAIDLGAIGGANYKNADWHKELAKTSGGFDVIVDGAGGPDFAKLIDMCKPGARIASYGATVGPWNAGVPAKIFWKQIDILGSTMGNDKEFEEMVAFISEHKIEPIVAKIFGLNQAQDAAKYMDEGKQFGKIVLEI
ncbi:MAG: zinc-binding dehydrogenase [Bacteroidia bacterium]|nr:zinc-binding dehydrogenase [Bacteroidia bacterium]MCF8427242.1 zinc-binding dehydrogenase [Bacteroidia bacterium]MCF8445998.1 zinc-binding dehydrogenase [Bacteroidia bacterium]